MALTTMCFGSMLGSSRETSSAIATRGESVGAPHGEGQTGVFDGRGGELQ
jgi:hypothetical protein